MAKLQLHIHTVFPRIEALFLVLLSVIPLGIPGMRDFVPMVDIYVVFFWAIYQPMAIPVWFLFFMGVFQDALQGTLIGTTAFTNILFAWLVVKQRYFFINEGFMVLWSGMIILSMLMMLVKLCLISLFAGTFMWTPSVLMQWVLTILLYPPVHSMFARTYQWGIAKEPIDAA